MKKSDTQTKPSTATLTVKSGLRAGISMPTLVRY